MTAFVASVVEFMYHVKPIVIALSSVVTAAASRAPKTALHARKTAATTASTASARRNVASHVILVMRNASGVAGIINARNYVGICAIVNGVTCRVQSYFRASIPVLVSVGKNARRSAESVTKTR